jgi:outer membrane protein assembly factor BamD (BamD/ComL family)
MGNLQINPQSKSETLGMDSLAMNHRSNSSLTKWLRLSTVVKPTSCLLLLATTPFSLGCASFNLFKKEDEVYVRARNAIEGYEDKEGNWIRPEGIRADKARNSSIPKALQFIPGLAPRPENKDVARQLYKEADEIFNRAVTLEGDARRAEFRAAAKKYKEAGKNWASSALEQDAFMMTAESYFFAEDYPKAEDYYAKVLKEYPRNRYQDKIDQRRMEIGVYWLQFKDEFYHVNLVDNKRPWNDTRKHGVRVLEKMRLDNPIGKRADDVTMQLANTAFERKNWNDALDTYSDLISTYPDSEHQFDAHFLGMKAALLSYQGAEYSAIPLDRAEKLIKQMVRQFPEKAKEEQDMIQDAFKEVRFRRAERLFTQATYRYNKSEARAARIHCQQILTEYSDTPFAEDAKAMMEKTGGMAPEPVQHLAWLADLFPNRDKITPLLKPLPNMEDNDMQRDTYERTAVRPDGTPVPAGDASGGNPSSTRR